MKRLWLILFSLLALVILRPHTIAQKVSIPCPARLDSIRDCPNTGCGNVDPHLNRQKNIRSSSQPPQAMTLQQIRDLDDPVKGFKAGNTRNKIRDLGEGKKIIVVANAIAVRKGGKESCNCGLTTVADTDNHIVLVDRVLRKKPGESAKDLLHRRELNSITAEFSPRVRLNHPNLTWSTLAPLIAIDGVQKVRVTGVLFFDSEHSLGHHLVRYNNWEIHPVLALEYCPRGQKCTADSDDNWVKIRRSAVTGFQGGPESSSQRIRNLMAAQRPYFFCKV